MRRSYWLPVIGVGVVIHDIFRGTLNVDDSHLSLLVFPWAAYQSLATATVILSVNFALYYGMLS